MTNEKLDSILRSTSDTIQGQNGRWQLIINDIPLICVTDDSNNRMRIISPIIESNKLDDEMKTNALIANFHTALDVKYAISDDILWAVFIHPLKELTDAQIMDALKQVYLANINFGTSYSSSPLVFPGRSSNNVKQEKPREEILKKGI